MVGRSVGRRGGQTAKGGVERRTDGSFYFFLEPPVLKLYFGVSNNSRLFVLQFFSVLVKRSFLLAKYYKSKALPAKGK